MKLSRAVEEYLDMKRFLGVSNKSAIGRLRAFCRQTGDIAINSVTKSDVRRFLDLGRTSDVVWIVKYRALKAFFQYWFARSRLRELPMPQARAVTVRPAGVPYIYSISDMRRLLLGTCFRLTSRKIHPATLRAVLVFLYGTGARINETLALEPDDVDLANNTVTFRHATRCTRTVPIGATLVQWLRTYVVSQSGDAQRFFAQKDGRPIQHPILLTAFNNVRRRMGVSRIDGMGRQPRLQDLRRTFAVHCLKEWSERRKDLLRMLPILSAYLGHAQLNSTEEYLSLIPGRFWKQLSNLSPQRQGASSRDEMWVEKMASLSNRS